MARSIHHAIVACIKLVLPFALVTGAVATPLQLAPALNNPVLSAGTKTVTLIRKQVPAAASASRASFLYHRVQSGDTLYDLARKYDLSTRDIKLANGMTKDDLRPGDSLKIPLHRAEVTVVNERRLPPGVRTYRVKAGEVVSSIAAKFDISEADVVSANPNLPSLDHLKAGTELLIPGKTRGMIAKLKPGQSLVHFALGYRVTLTSLVAANGLTDPRDLKSGDLVLIPGVQARQAIARLEAKRGAELAEAARQHTLALEKEKARRELARLEAAKREATQKAQAAAKAQASKREALRARQRANVAKVQRAAIYVRPVEPSDSGGYRWPMNSFSITSGYGRRGFWIGRSNFHTGIDLASSYRAPIYAAKSGTVIEAGYGYFGLNVRVSAGRGVTNIYGHMSRIAVGNGEYVRKGALIGYQGCTGICTGPHLHFEVQVNGVPRNPLRYLP